LPWLPAGTSNLREARAVWLNRQLLQWPTMAAGSGTYKFYTSAAGQVRARVGAAVSGHDAVLTLQPFTGTVPAEARARFGWVGGAPCCPWRVPSWRACPSCTAASSCWCRKTAPAA
jgi:hypothetical protein